MADSDDKKQARLQQEAEMDEVFKSEQTTIVPVDLDGEMKKSCRALSGCPTQHIRLDDINIRRYYTYTVKSSQRKRNGSLPRSFQSFFIS